MKITDSNILDLRPTSHDRTIYDRGTGITYHYSMTVLALASMKNKYGVYIPNNFGVRFNYDMNVGLIDAICEVFGNDSFLTKESFCHRQKDCRSGNYPKMCEYINNYCEFCNRNNVVLGKNCNIHYVYVGTGIFNAI